MAYLLIQNPQFTPCRLLFYQHTGLVEPAVARSLQRPMKFSWLA
jgi:hypothetical protein